MVFLYRTHVKIEIVGFSTPDDVMNLENKYHIQVVGCDENDGYWEHEPEEGLEISTEEGETSMWANKPGTYNIKFMIGDELIAERRVKVIDQ